jgi:hypothetical protein
MYILSTARDVDGAGACEVTVETTLDLPRLVYPARRLIERLLRRLNDDVLREDRVLLERRQALFGDDVEDYLRDEQCLLFKEAFRRHYAKAGQGARPETAAAGAAR